MHAQESLNPLYARTPTLREACGPCPGPGMDMRSTGATSTRDARTSDRKPLPIRIAAPVGLCTGRVDLSQVPAHHKAPRDRNVKVTRQPRKRHRNKRYASLLARDGATL